MKKILIVSLHFSPAYIGHMMAWYKLCEQCGYKVMIFIGEQYVTFFHNTGLCYSTNYEELSVFKPDFAVVQNTGFENIAFFRWCKNNNCSILYILHEPYMGIKELLKDGKYCIKQAIACCLNSWLCKKAKKVILCSQYAEENCRRYMKGAYRKRERFPLIFMDEYQEEGEKRNYFSLIGAFATSKGSDLFLDFVKYATLKEYDISFQIATRTNLDKQLNDESLQKLIRNKKLLVQHGRDMTPEEINGAYRRSICCWNGYRRTTQSGVLPNAFMLGTPVLATKLGSFCEFVVPNHTGVFINNKDPESIYNGFKMIKDHNESMSKDCRRFFLTNFYYRNQIQRFKSLVENSN